MQSSSTLFPVALLSAERRGDLSEDIYRIKAANSPDPSVELALTRLGLADQPGARGVPVILLHGSFSNRRFWYSPKGIGLGPWLARRGFDVWIAEMRGHGLSPRNQHYARNTVADYARYDLPVIGAFVAEVSAQTPHWVGHSLGGITLAAALGGSYLQGDLVASAALFGAQVTRRHWPLRIPPLNWASRCLLKRYAHISGGDAERDWWEGLGEVKLPLLAVAAAGDLQDPSWACHQLFEQFAGSHNQFIDLGRKAGFTDDFDHVRMLVSPQAQAEVWPLVGTWLQDPYRPLLPSATPLAMA
jgi:pimeloyl-ACP methyl ester carboxylesterase